MPLSLSSKHFPQVLESFAEFAATTGSTERIIAYAYTFIYVVNFHSWVAHTYSTDTENNWFFRISHELIDVVLNMTKLSFCGCSDFLHANR
jgi:hypothetical protein